MAFIKIYSLCVYIYTYPYIYPGTLKLTKSIYNQDFLYPDNSFTGKEKKTGKRAGLGDQDSLEKQAFHTPHMLQAKTRNPETWPLKYAFTNRCLKNQVEHSNSYSGAQTKRKL